LRLLDCLGHDGIANRAGVDRLLESPTMRQILRLFLVILAAAMHVAAPVVSYAAPATVALPGDICTSVRGASTATPNRAPAQHSSEHHCAHAPCCPAGAHDSAAAPPPVLAVLAEQRTADSSVGSAPAAAAIRSVLAAQPRGPPSHG
jgi:hypothetical protein